MVAHKQLRVRAVAGKFVARRPARNPIGYLGRKYDPDGDKKNLEAEFPPIPEGIVVEPDAYIRKAIHDGELVELGEEE